jgi:glutamate-1-semialdehyde 2,1-aminomutase
MEQFLPTGEVFFAGTFNGTPLPLANALEVIKELETNYPYEALDQFRQDFSDKLLILAKKHGVQFAIQGVASMMSLAFGCDEYIHGVQHSSADPDAYVRFADYLAKQHSILLPPLFTETIFLAPIHQDVEQDLLTAFDKAFAWLSKHPKTS